MYITSLGQLPDIAASCVTIGNFDGVHQGHRTLIQNICHKARHLGACSVVVTFWPHPLQVLAGRHAPPLLTSRGERQRLLHELGVGMVLELPFDRQLAALSPAEFVHTVLTPLRCRELVIGYDFSLGKGRAGNVDVLTALGKTCGFGVEQMPPVIINDAVVSSSRMRDLLRAGEVWELQAIAGRCHAVSGQVVRGYQRGTALGFPTANLAPEDNMLPKAGVYATWAAAKGQIWPGVTNIGVNPTFGNDGISVETFLLDADERLYGERMTLHFVQRLRDEQRFDSVDALARRIARDAELARGILSSAEKP